MRYVKPGPGSPAVSDYGIGYGKAHLSTKGIFCKVFVEYEIRKYLYRDDE